VHLGRQQKQRCIIIGEFGGTARHRYVVIRIDNSDGSPNESQTHRTGVVSFQPEAWVARTGTPLYT
jgi:hypothetical protein